MPETTDPPPAPSSFDELLAQERRLVQERRRVAAEATGIEADIERPTVGIALSGGGIRSATFCLGLLRGLAQNKLLHRVDYLSTVSGGGFIGAALGRLIMAVGLKRAQAALADSGSLLMWWLRSNGRYLTPSGSRDRAMAMVTYFRAWVAVQLEFGLMCAAVALVVLLPHMAQELSGALDPERWSPWMSWWFPMAALLLIALLPGVMVAYWFAKDAPTQVAGPALSSGGTARRTGSPVPLWLGSVISIALLCGFTYCIVRQTAGASSPFEPLNMLMLAAAGAIFCTGLTLSRLPPINAPNRSLRVAEVRNAQTRWLRRIFLLGMTALAIGAIDCGSWMLLRWTSTLTSDPLSPWSSAGGFAALLILLRTFSESLGKTARASDGSQLTEIGPKLLNLGGVLFALSILVAWTCLLQYLVFLKPGFGPGYHLLCVALIVLGWIVWSGRNADTPNSSSLHSFYRARLTRSYLAIGNVGQGKRFRAVDEAATDQNIAEVRRVTEVVEGDDLGLVSYQPELCGGPIHLINACLNQTREDRSGLYNADRKGMMLTATARGLELGRQRFVALNARSDAGTLGRWIAISGGAVSPGAGSYTTRGWAAMMFLLGVRLGYWVRAASADTAKPPPFAGGLSASIERFSWWALPKIKMLRAEFGARFFGTAKPWWYLSDGGHFENTGVYPLLRRQLDFILLADCGADPKFDLKDIETLVRKARLDFGAEITFYSRDTAETLWPTTERPSSIQVLSLDELADNRTGRGVLLAHIAYAAASDGKALSGTLLIVKPNLHNQLDVDLLAYARRNPLFPQQSTSNQFFDESQWESYQRLGEDFGRALTTTWLSAVPGWSKPAVAGAHLPTASKDAVPSGASDSSGSIPFWRRGAAVTAVGATLGFGATGTLLLAAIQLTDHFGKRFDDLNKRAETTYTLARKVSGSNGKLSDTAVLDKKLLDEATEASKALIQFDALGVHDRFLQTRISNYVQSVSAECESINERVTDPLTLSDAENNKLTFCADWIRERNEWSRAGLMYGYWTNRYHSEGSRKLSAAPGTTAPSAGVEVGAATGAQVDSTLNRDCGPGRKFENSRLIKEPDYPAVVRFFAQVYDEPTRAEATKLTAALEKDAPIGFRIQPTENVTASAAKYGRRTPYVWPQPTLIVHKVTEHKCATAIAEVMRKLKPELWQNVRVMPLPPDLYPQPGTIELWLPSDGGLSSRR